MSKLFYQSNSGLQAWEVGPGIILYRSHDSDRDVVFDRIEAMELAVAIFTLLSPELKEALVASVHPI